MTRHTLALSDGDVLARILTLEMPADRTYRVGERIDAVDLILFQMVVHSAHTIRRRVCALTRR